MVMYEPRLCDNCGRQLESDEVGYWVRLEIFASPDPPIITQEDLDQDHVAKMQALVEKMEQLDPDEAEAQVYEAYRFVVCSNCRNYFHEHLKHRRTQLS